MGHIYIYGTHRHTDRGHTVRQRTHIQTWITCSSWLPREIDRGHSDKHVTHIQIGDTQTDRQGTHSQTGDTHTDMDHV
jgi:hypothetical protein